MGLECVQVDEFRKVHALPSSVARCRLCVAEICDGGVETAPLARVLVRAWLRACLRCVALGPCILFPGLGHPFWSKREGGHSQAHI